MYKTIAVDRNFEELELDRVVCPRVSFIDDNSFQADVLAFVIIVPYRYGRLSIMETTMS